MRAPFVRLHAHSYYYFLDGASSPEALARRAADLDRPALALTDWSGLYGAVAFDRACHAVGVRRASAACAHPRRVYRGGLDRRGAETVAECAAFVILHHFGLNTRDYTFPYVAG